MDNLTHTLLGLVAAKAGLEKLSPGATSLCLVAANAPDADIVVLFFGDRWDFLQHHRGITHALLGTAGLVLVIPLLFYLVDRALARIRHRPANVKIKGLLIASMIVGATHPLLDWTNNYGVRLLLPWSPKWFYGDLVFIVDPFMWLMLGGAAFLMTARTRIQRSCWLAIGAALTLLVLAGPRSGTLPNALLIRVIWISAMGSLVVLFAVRAGERWGSQIALVSLALVVLYWSGLAFAHGRALKKAEAEALHMLGTNGETILKLATMPTLANPLRWDCVFETDHATYRFTLDLAGATPIGKIIRYAKPSPPLTQMIQRVSQDRRAKIFLAFARFPVADLEDPNCTAQALVQFADLRYTEPGNSRGTFSLELPVDCSDAR